MSFFSKWAWKITIILMILHLMFICLYGVNLPLYDEWDLYIQPELAQTLPLEWFFRFHNEHRMVTTKMFAWIFYHTSKLEMVSFLLVTFVFYCLLLFQMRILLIRFSPQNASYSFLFFPFLLSLAYADTFQYTAHIAFHLCYLFFLSGVYLVFIKSNKIIHFICGLLFLFLSIYSNAFGLFLGSSLWIVLSVYFLISKKLNNDLVFQINSSRIYVLLCFLPLWIGLWFLDYKNVGHHPSMVFPWSLKFWEFYLNYFSFAFGYQWISWKLGLFCFLITLLPWLWVVIQKYKWKSPHSFYWALLGLALFSTMGSITLGRAGFGLGNSKTPRYIEFAAIILPFCAVIWAEFLDGVFSKKKHLKNIFILSLWMFTFIGFLNDWQFRKYGPYQIAKKRGINCILKNEASNGFTCESIHFSDMKEKLNVARELDISFLEELNKKKLACKEACN